MTAVLTPTFGQLLKHHRLHHGLSQERLAEAANLSVNQISDLERDQRARPHPDTLRRLADALGLAERERATFVSLARPGRPTAIAPARPRLPLSLTRYFAPPEIPDAVRRRLASARLLTLTGSGGVGKTRLALEVAHAVAPEYPDGVWLIDLAGLREEALVPQTVARTLGLPEQHPRPALETLLAALRERRLLLVIDNCEHLLDACAHLADQLLRYCPGVRILATSRERLRLDGEHVWPVQPLGVPSPRQPLSIDTIAGFPAIQLFVDRAAAVLPEFALTADNAATVARVCRLLDGIPLAIELAAARVPTLPLDELAARLGDRFRLLTEGSRAAAPRHQTLRAALEWGDALLAEQERTLLWRLSVFAGGWTLPAAERVAWGNGIAAAEIVDRLGRLVAKSLVQAERVGDGLRYRLLEMVRQYAAEQLAAGDETSIWQGRHAEYFLALAEEAEPALASTEQTGWLERLEDEHDNLRAALRYLIARGASGEATRLAGALGQFWQLRGYLREGRQWLEQVLALRPAAPVAARLTALEELGEMAWKQGDYLAARDTLETGRALAESADNLRSLSNILRQLGTIALHQVPPDLGRATALFEECLTVRRALQHERGIAVSINDLGLVALEEGAFARARERFEEALARSRTLGAERMATIGLVNLGILGMASGEHDQAQARFVECLGRVILPEDDLVVAYALAGLAGLASGAGRAERAAQLLGASEAVLARINYALPTAHRERFGQHVAAARSQLDAATWAAAWARGHSLTTEHAVALALAET